MLSCTSKQQQNTETPVDVDLSQFSYDDLPDFTNIQPEVFLPSVQKLIQLHNEEIAKIAENKALPTFENTIEAIEFSGKTLDRTVRIFNTLYFADTNDQLDSVAEILLPKITEHESEIYTNDKLFHRIEVIRNKKDTTLTDEQQYLLEKYYKNFVRNGAALNAEQKKQLAEIEKQISFMQVQFSKNLLAEINDYKLVIENKTDLDGIPQNIIDLAAADAEKAGMKGKWVFTMQKSSFIPFMQYAKNRDLRKKLYEAYYNRGTSKNKTIVNNILNLRIDKAKLLGYNTYADFVLDNNMAENTQNVYALLDEIWRVARKKAISEAKDLQEIIDDEGNDFELQAWDWWYYAEKLRQSKYRLDETEIQQYLSLDNVREGAFLLAKKLWNVNFKEMQNVKVYNNDVKVYAVYDNNGKELGVLYTDYFPRDGKRSGAWMDELSCQYKENGTDHRPIVINVANFTRPTNEKPSLLSIDEVETLFHEFGHAMNSLFSQCTYPSTSGVNTPSDFVEMPSQLLENWATEPAMLKLYAKHYKTNEVMPDSLITQIQKSKKFNQGFETVELLAATYIDLNLHCIENKETDRDIQKLEEHYLTTICMPEMIAPRYRTAHFNHSFAFGYEAAYYSYIWSRVLSADCFKYFKHSGNIFNKEIAESYRKNILEKGNTQNPMQMYINFRGHKPNPQMLIENIR